MTPRASILSEAQTPPFPIEENSKTKEELHNLFFHLREKYGQTIVIVTHDPDLAKMCDRSLYMVDGQFV